MEIPKSSAYYVRTALQAALAQQESKLEWLESVRDDPSDNVSPMYTGMLRGEISHTKQWLKEAKEEFAKFPEEIRPVTG